MMVNAAAEDALERIVARAGDVQNAFTPGASSPFGDVMTDAAGSRMTLDPLSVAAPADAYFIATDERGRTVYTRDGGFALAGGTLVGANGRAILGFRSASSPTGELHIDDVDAALNRAANVRIEADGTLAYDRAIIEPRTGARETERVAVGRIALARFPAATKLAPSDANHFLAPAGIVPHVGRAGDGSFASVAPMERATSRIDFDRSLDRLEEAYVAFDALQAAHKVQGGIGKTAMDLLK